MAVAARFIKRAAGKPVIVGVSNPSVAQMRDLTARVTDRGAAGVMIAPSAGLRTEEALLAWFDVVFKEIGNVPTVLQDFPFSSGVWMSVDTVLALVERYPQIQVLKEEDLPSLGKITRLREKGKRRIAILTGNNAVCLPLELGRGIDGPMAGFSHPEMLSGVYRGAGPAVCPLPRQTRASWMPILRSDRFIPRRQGAGIPRLAFGYGVCDGIDWVDRRWGRSRNDPVDRRTLPTEVHRGHVQPERLHRRNRRHSAR